jgi:hypothetical protein
MLLERLTIFVALATLTNLACLAALLVATYYNVRNYRVLQRIQQRTPAVPNGATERVRQPRVQPSERYDSHDQIDRGQVEWTGPVTPYVPDERNERGSGVTPRNP